MLVCVYVYMCVHMAFIFDYIKWNVSMRNMCFGIVTDYYFTQWTVT